MSAATGADVLHVMRLCVAAHVALRTTPEHIIIIKLQVEVTRYKSFNFSLSMHLSLQISFWTVLSLFQERSMWKMFVTHMYLLSMWDEGKLRTLYAQLKDFEHFEEWYRSELRGRLVQRSCK